MKENEFQERLGRRFRALMLGAAAILVCAFFFHLSGDKLGTTMRSDMSGESSETAMDVQGIPCIGHVTYHSNGKIKSCTLARMDTLNGQPLPAGTVVNFSPAGLLDWCFLQHDTEIQGHLCKGQGHGWMTCFHPNGKLRVAWLGRDETIQGVPIAEYNWWADAFGKGAGVYFWENGLLRRCRISKEFSIEGKTFQKGDIVSFDSDGNLAPDTK
jgi:antitoxin component YwqK of YwqJK toxin-antitoxin module